MVLKLVILNYFESIRLIQMINFQHSQIHNICVKGVLLYKLQRDHSSDKFFIVFEILSSNIGHCIRFCIEKVLHTTRSGST